MREIVEDPKGSGTVVEIGTTKRRRPAARKAAGARARKPSGRPRASAAKRRAPRAASFESVIRSITGGVGVARAAIAEASGQGASAVKSALGTASSASRKTVKRLAGEWKAMDPKKKAGILAALLGAAAAAASAPIVRKRLTR